MKFKAPVVSLVLAAAIAATGCASAPTTASARRSDIADAQSRVDKAVNVVDEMKADPAMAVLLRSAKGVLVVPEYAQAAFIIGGQGGVGVLMAHNAGRWSDPAFFSVGGLSVGFQAGGQVGAVAYVLMTERAVQQFETRTNRFSLGADAGLTVVKYSSKANIVSTAAPAADVVAWTDTEGLFGGVAFDATDVMTNSRLDEAYYHGLVSVRRILDDSVHNQMADRLETALSTRVAQD